MLLDITKKNAWKALTTEGDCFIVETAALKRADSNERLVSAGFFDVSLAYESIQSDSVFWTVR